MKSNRAINRLGDDDDEVVVDLYQQKKNSVEFGLRTPLQGHDDTSTTWWSSLITCLGCQKSPDAKLGEFQKVRQSDRFYSSDL